MKYFFTTVVLLISVSLGFAQIIDIKGVVNDASTSEAIIGASVQIKGSTLGTVTNENGEFSIAAPSDAIIVISYIGFQTLEVAVNGQRNLRIALDTDQISLDEFVVIGYGTVKKSNVTGAITSVKQEDLKTVPTTNVMEALQGKLPGVDITRSSGQAGSGVNVLVRGNRSLTASNTPLFIVDGIQYSNVQDINPNDIESMEVLKDAASTAIYGSRGANGVIIITTKKGSKGKTNVSFNAYTGSSSIAGYPRVMDAEEYKNYRREANRTTGNWTGPEDDAKIFGNQLNNPGTYWPDLFLQNGSQSDYQLGISAGNDKTSMYLSLDYFNEKGLFTKDQLKRYSLRANVDHSINKIFTVGTQNQITYYDQDLRFDPMNTVNQLIPLESPYDSLGNINVLLNNGRNINPLMDEQPNNYENNLRTTRVFTSAYVGVNILENLSFRSNLGINLTNTREGLYAGSQTNFRNGSQALSRYIAGNSLGLNMENILNYNLNAGKHGFVFTAVQSVLTNKFESVTAQGADQLIASQLYYGLANANAQVSIGADLKESALHSYTGRIMYNFNDKYLLNVTGRYDGASQLSDDNKWAFFPSASAAWRISQEDFLADNMTISDLKLRVSYGVAGNSAVEPYSTQSVLNRVPFAWDEAAAIGYSYSTRIGNEDLRWETSTTFNVGLDFGIFKNRVTGSIDVFNTNTSDLLLQRLLPLTSGALSTIENVGETTSKGIELGINAVVVNNRNFKWNLGLNWFRVKEEIVKLATESNDVANGWFIGETTYPVLGEVSDLLIAAGGSTILSEFPELCGVEQELIDRCASEADAERFIQLMRNYEARAKQAGSGFDMNPSPGNIKDGLITDAMKSAGAAKKGGTSPIEAVLDYPELLTKPGLNLLCTPGNDVESTTALVGSGSNIVLFTTGLGTPTGNPIAPVIKVSSNNQLALRMPGIIDFNTGNVITGEENIRESAHRLIHLIIEIASGRSKAKATLNQQYDFIPWKRGVSL